MVFPSYVGYDIGCGMCAVKLDMSKSGLHVEKIKQKIIDLIPLGMSKRAQKQEYEPLPCTPVAQGFYDEVGAYQLGTERTELKWGPSEQRIHPVALAKHGYEKARRIGMMAMIGGKDKTRIRNATPPEFRDLLLAIARSANKAPNAPSSADAKRSAGMKG
jgi:hypothetical protein